MTDVAETGFAIHPMDQFIVKPIFREIEPGTCVPAEGIYEGCIKWYEITNVTVWMALAVLAIVVAKALSYGVSLGGGWRGGPIFPAAYIGVAAAVLMGLLITSTPMSALVVAGLAGGVAAMLKLPFTAGLLAIVIGAGAGLVVTPMAIIGAIVGVALRMAYDKATGRTGVPMTP